MDMCRTILTTIALGVALIGLTARPAFAQQMPKAQVANLIAKVENGVDEFRNYLEKRGNNAKDTASTTQVQGKSSRRKATDMQKPKASTKKDALDDRLWAVLRTGINDLARAYGVSPLGV
jgi:hypothetical protein